MRPSLDPISPADLFEHCDAKTDFLCNMHQWGIIMGFELFQGNISFVSRSRHQTTWHDGCEATTSANTTAIPSSPKFFLSFSKWVGGPATQRLLLDAKQSCSYTLGPRFLLFKWPGDGITAG